MILKLMIVEIKRYLRSLYYLVVLFILFLIHMLGLKGGVPFLFWGDDFLEKGNMHDVVGKGYLQFIKCSKRCNV